MGGGPGGAEAPPGPSVVGSIGSIIRSVRSIIVQPTSVDSSDDPDTLLNFAPKAQRNFLVR